MDVDSFKHTPLEDNLTKNTFTDSYRVLYSTQFDIIVWVF